MVTIPEEEQDKKIEEKLLKELPGILNWALEGLREYHRIRLQPPDIVKAATEAYRKENDSLEAFVSQECEVRKLAICKNVDLYSAYLGFCRMNGFEPLSQTKFSTELKDRKGITVTRGNYGIMWHGITLLSQKIVDIPTLHSKTDKLSLGEGEGVQGVKANAQPFLVQPRVENLAQKAAHPTHPTLHGLHKEAADWKWRVWGHILERICLHQRKRKIAVRVPWH